MTKYSFVGFPVQPNAVVDLPDDAIVVGANFTIQNQWQIMCLVPIPAEAPSDEKPPEGEGEHEEGEEHADVPPES